MLININTMRDWKAYNGNYCAEATKAERAMIKESLCANGKVSPIYVTQVDREYRIVDGTLRVILIGELIDEGKWTHGDQIDVTLVAPNKAPEIFIASNFAKKTYTTFQQTLFCICNLWDASLSAAKNHEKIGNIIGLSRETVRKMYKAWLASGQSKKFYDLIYRKRAKIKDDDLFKDLFPRLEEEKNVDGKERLLDMLIEAYQIDPENAYSGFKNMIISRTELDSDTFANETDGFTVATTMASKNTPTVTYYLYYRNEDELPPNIQSVKEALDHLIISDKPFHFELVKLGESEGGNDAA